MSIFTDAATALLKEPRFITREEAEAAAAILLACNGHDMSNWTDDEFTGESLGGLGAEFLRRARTTSAPTN